VMLDFPGSDGKAARLDRPLSPAPTRTRRVGVISPQFEWHLRENVT
jgi:hypothetical protein